MAYYDTKMEMAAQLFRLRLKFDRFINPIAAESGLTVGCAVLLHIIASCSEPTVKTVVSELEINQGNASTMCKQLETLGYIKKHRREDDERSVKLELTDSGKDALYLLNTKLNAFFSEKLSAEDVDLLCNAARDASETISRAKDNLEWRR